MPVQEVVGTEVDYFKLFALLKAEFNSCYLFESTDTIPRHQDRYVSLGFDPLFTVKANGKELTFTGKPEVLTKFI